MSENIEQEIFTLQKKIMLNLCLCFYSNEDLCILSYILNSLEKNEQIKLDALANKFSTNSLEYLKSGRFIKEVETSEKNQKLVAMNQDLFVILESVCKKIEDSLTEQRKKIQQNSDKVKCKKCGLLRDKVLSLSGFMKCDHCQTSEVIIINTDNSEKLGEIKLLAEMINRIMQWKDQLDVKKKQLIAYKESLENNNFVQNQITDMKDVMRTVEKELEQIRKKTPEMRKSLWSFEQLKNTGYYIRRAEQDYRPKREYSKIKQIETIRKRRKTENLKK